jgi:hypothetical protein
LQIVYTKIFQGGRRCVAAEKSVVREGFLSSATRA